jgi:hypothetical protein
MAYANTISFEDRAIAGQDMIWAARAEQRRAARKGYDIDVADLLDISGYQDDGYDFDLADDDIIGGIRFN